MNSTKEKLLIFSQFRAINYSLCHGSKTYIRLKETQETTHKEVSESMHNDIDVNGDTDRLYEIPKHITQMAKVLHKNLKRERERDPGEVNKNEWLLIFFFVEEEKIICYLLL